MRDRNKNVRRLLDVADTMIEVADTGLAGCADENCVGLFGLAKDCGYRIRTEAEREFAAHLEKPVKKSLKGE
jgi:hypothetical protein